MKRFRRIVTIIAVFVFLTGSLGGAAVAAGNTDKDLIGYQKTDPTAMLVDVIATRPLGMASIVVGTATYIVSLPFSLLGGNAGVAFNRLVAYPFGYTFLRRLGDI